MDETSRTPKEVARRDPFRAHVYGEVWGVLGELQPGGALPHVNELADGRV